MHTTPHRRPVQLARADERHELRRAVDKLDDSATIRKYLRRALDNTFRAERHGQSYLVASAAGDATAAQKHATRAVAAVHIARGYIKATELLGASQPAREILASVYARTFAARARAGRP